MRGVKTLLVGESKTGKTACLDTLPGGLIDFSWDIGGWRTLARTKDEKRKLDPSEEGWVTGKGNPITIITNFKKWMENVNRPLLPKERLVVDYANANPIALGQFTEVSAIPVTNFIYDANILWNKQQECVDKGFKHTIIDSLTSFQKPVLDYVLAMNGRVVKIAQDWGQGIDKINEIVQSFVALPFDFILTAHTQIEKDELIGKVKETLLIFGKALPSVLLAKFDDIFYSTAERGLDGTTSYKWGTGRSGPTSVFVSKGMDKNSPPAQNIPFEGIPVGTRNFSNLPLKIEQDFEKLYKGRLFDPTPPPTHLLEVGGSGKGGKG